MDRESHNKHYVEPTIQINPFLEDPHLKTLSRSAQDPQLKIDEGSFASDLANVKHQSGAYEDDNTNGSTSLHEQNNDSQPESEMEHLANSLSLQAEIPADTSLDGSVQDSLTRSCELASHNGQDARINQDCDSIHPPRISSLSRAAKNAAEIPVGILSGITSSRSPVTRPSAAPPEPDPEPELPFDFHRFLEQLRHRTADPVAKFLRSFLIEFGRKQWMVHEQVKLVRDFLQFITNKMARCEVWREVTIAEFDHAKEGMEKLVMNRLYTQTFSPAIASPMTTLNTKGRLRSRDSILEFGRRGQHQEDIERDEIFRQKVRIYSWIQEEHLDIPRVSDSGRRFLVLAQQELLKINTYRAPRDKVICVLNCCKVIFGILRNTNASDTSADSFVPLLIYVVLHANPEHLVSNVQYIMRFRNQDKIGGEAGYYLSSLMGAVHFVENLDRTSLTISDKDFEENVEAAVSIIAEKPSGEPLYKRPMHLPGAPTVPGLAEKAAPSQPEIVTRNSIEAERSSPRIPSSSHRRSEHIIHDPIDTSAVGGLLRTIGKPLSNIGRIFSDDLERQDSLRNSDQASRSPLPLTSDVFQPPRLDREEDGTAIFQEQIQAPREEGDTQYKTITAGKTASRQTSAEVAEAECIKRVEYDNIVETLTGMFPGLDKDIIVDVVRQKRGRVGLAVDACLILNS